MRRRPWLRLFFALVLAAILIYPMYGLLLLGFDTLLGSRQLIDWYLFESHPVLMTQEFNDIRASFAVVLPTILLATLLTALLAYRRGLPGLLIGTALVLLVALGLLLAGSLDRNQAGLFSAALAFTAFLATAFSRITRHAR
jgi:hypothetical protein